MDEKTAHPPLKANTNDPENLRGRYESLVFASANITLTMLRRGEVLEADLSRALEHVRESNKYLKEFVQLLDAVDGDRWNERERVGSWLDIAGRARSVNDSRLSQTVITESDVLSTDPEGEKTA